MTHLASNTHHCANMTSLSTPVANLDSVTVLSYFFKASCPRGSVTSGYMRLWKLSRAHRSLKGWDQWPVTHMLAVQSLGTENVHCHIHD